MKIGVMLRHVGEPGGIGVYTEHTVRGLLEIDTRNTYYLIYDRASNVGHFAGYSNATEMVVTAPHKLVWDQVAVPRLARREGLDLIFNPKLSVPLFTKSKTVLVMHGAAQFVVPEAFRWYDRLYFGIANRLYCRTAAAIITATHTGASDIARYMGADPRKIHAIYDSYNEACRVLSPEETAPVREKYGLPERYLLFIGGITPLKNMGNILRAFALLRSRIPHKLVVVGFKRWKFASDLRLVDELNLRDGIVFTDYVPDEDVPALYNMADVFVFPSLYEGFGIPVPEAMACGCPVVTSKNGCSPEVAGGGALLVDPYNPADIAHGIERLLSDDDLRERLVARGLKRAADFSWERTVRETLALFESLGGGSRHGGATVTHNGRALEESARAEAPRDEVSV